MNIIVLIYSLTGMLYSKYDKKGEIKKKVPIRGVLSTILMTVLIVAFFITFDYFALKNVAQVNFIIILRINFALLILLDLYDAIFIDLFVIGLWRPRILKLKNYYSLDSMKTHVKKQFTIGWIIKIPLLLISSFCFSILS